MSKQRPIAYEPHPVSPKRKAELWAQGYQIIDAVFKPAGSSNPGQEAPAGKPSDGLKVDELKAALAAKGVEIPDGVTLKADLAKLLDEAA